MICSLFLVFFFLNLIFCFKEEIPAEQTFLRNIFCLNLSNALQYVSKHYVVYTYIFLVYIFCLLLIRKKIENKSICMYKVCVCVCMYINKLTNKKMNSKSIRSFLKSKQF